MCKSAGHGVDAGDTVLGRRRSRFVDILERFVGQTPIRGVYGGTKRVESRRGETGIVVPGLGLEPVLSSGL